jgi:AraC-like DNA-binding protein
LEIQSTSGAWLSLQVTADRFPRIVIQCLEGKNALHSADYSNIDAASLKGITSRPAFFQMESAYAHIAVSFFPHGIKALFGIDGHETIDAVLDLHEFIPRDVIEKIIDAQHAELRKTLLEEFLLKQLSAAKSIDWRVVNFLSISHETQYGRQLKEYGISERQFERKFLQAIGFTPSYYRRVVRFERALYRIQHHPRQSLADIAYELGYSDQSHFNREFKQFAGFTPASRVRKEDLVKESGSIVAA